MKQTIRYNTFETNSSVSHTITVVPKKDIEENKHCFYSADIGYLEHPILSGMVTEEDIEKLYKTYKDDPILKYDNIARQEAFKYYFQEEEQIFFSFSEYEEYMMDTGSNLGSIDFTDTAGVVFTITSDYRFD